MHFHHGPIEPGKRYWTWLPKYCQHRLPDGLPDGMLVKTVRNVGDCWEVELVDLPIAKSLGVSGGPTWLVHLDLLVRVESEMEPFEPPTETLWDRALGFGSGGQRA